MAPISTTQAEQVLKQVVEDGAFSGAAPVRLSADHAVSYDTQTKTAALACGGGWMLVPFDVIRRLSESTPR